MFEWESPWVLFLSPLPFLIWYLLPALKPHISIALKVPFYSGIQSLVKERTLPKNNFSLVLLSILWLLLLLALAGPGLVGQTKNIKRDGYNIMLALDLSESMEVQDMSLNNRPASRLSIVKEAAEQFVKTRNNDKIGLILFGERAYLQTPLTYDTRHVLMRIADATAGLAGKTTSIGDALGLAVKRFQNVPSKERIVILLTDGTNTSGNLKPLKAAELARDEGIRIYTIGLGSEVDPLALSAGFIMPNMAADLDEETLKSIAEMTGGLYFRATDTQSLHSIYKTIDALEPTEADVPPTKTRKELYPYILAFCFFVSLLWIILGPFNVSGRSTSSW